MTVTHSCAGIGITSIRSDLGRPPRPISALQPTKRRNAPQQVRVGLTGAIAFSIRGWCEGYDLRLARRIFCCRLFVLCCEYRFRFAVRLNVNDLADIFSLMV